MKQIRVATEVDVDNLVNLIATFRDHLSLQLPNKAEIFSSLERLLVENNVEFLIACTDADVAVAYTQIRYYYSLWSTGVEAQIEDLFVLPGARGRGLGSRLVQSVICCARERGCSLIVLNTKRASEKSKTPLGVVA
jgi:GNAT superfamily N-acetyltransferase